MRSIKKPTAKQVEGPFYEVRKESLADPLKESGIRKVVGGGRGVGFEKVTPLKTSLYIIVNPSNKYLGQNMPA